MPPAICPLNHMICVIIVGSSYQTQSVYHKAHVTEFFIQQNIIKFIHLRTMTGGLWRKKTTVFSLWTTLLGVIRIYYRLISPCQWPAITIGFVVNRKKILVTAFKKMHFYAAVNITELFKSFITIHSNEVITTNVNDVLQHKGQTSTSLVGMFPFVLHYYNKVSEKIYFKKRKCLFSDHSLRFQWTARWTHCFSTYSEGKYHQEKQVVEQAAHAQTPGKQKQRGGASDPISPLRTYPQ